MKEEEVTVVVKEMEVMVAGKEEVTVAVKEEGDGGGRWWGRRWRGRRWR